jgi:hypothetical protein
MFVVLDVKYIYIHIPKHEKSGLHPCAFEGIMVGYNEHFKIFK